MSTATTKKWYESKGIWGALVTLLAGLAMIFDYAISPAEQAQLADLLYGVATSIGGVVAWIGRKRASKRIE